LQSGQRIVKPRIITIAERAGAALDRVGLWPYAQVWLGPALIGSGALSSLPAFAQSKPDFAQSAKGVVSSLDLQTAFPNAAVANESESWSFGDGSARVLLWVAVAIGVVVILLYLRDILPGGGLARRKKWGAAESGLALGESGAEAQAQINADELARLGRFVEAMHVLLLQALADMRHRLDVVIADSLTSREILRRAKVSPLAKSALQEIIGAVERAYFGDHPTGETDYRSCRDNFTTFVGALRSGEAR
jgi:hypothetical protein